MRTAPCIETFCSQMELVKEMGIKLSRGWWWMVGGMVGWWWVRTNYEMCLITSREARDPVVRAVL